MYFGVLKTGIIYQYLYRLYIPHTNNYRSFLLGKAIVRVLIDGFRTNNLAPNFGNQTIYHI